MTLLQTTPVEVRQLDINQFRKTLNDLMDDPEGIWAPTNHIHTAPLTISGVTLARVVEILSPYTITFEDGSYNVNIVGGNSNIADVNNKNSVGINTANSAGLQDPFSLQAASYAGEVVVKANSGFSGTQFPIGTRSSPVDNLADALSIAQTRGLPTFRIIGDLTLTVTDFSDGFIFAADSPVTTTVTIDPDTNITNCTFVNMTVTGTLDGDNTFDHCTVSNLNFFNGLIRNCALSGTITLGGGATAGFVNCYSDVPGGGVGQAPTVNMGGSSDTDLLVRGFSGGLILENCTASVDASLDFDSGRFEVASDVSAGTFTVRGIAEVIDNSTGTATVDDQTVGSALFNTNIAAAVFDEDLSTHTAVGSAGEALTKLLGYQGENKVVEVLTKDGAGNPLTQRMRLYDTEANANTNDGNTGLLAELNIVATFTGTSMDTFKSTE